MRLELITRTTHHGDIIKQVLTVDNISYEIKGFNIWEGDNVKIGDKLYDLRLKDYLHGGEAHGNIYQYLLIEAEEAKIKDISKVIMDLLEDGVYEENFKIEQQVK